MAGLLVGTIVALLLVTALGIVGLTSFWVSQRRRQIGVRRALGATRGDILRYFQTENFLIVSVGIAMGMLLAYGLNQGLMQQYELARLPAFYLPVRSEEHTSELQSLMRIPYAVFCLKKKTTTLISD